MALRSEKTNWIPLLDDTLAAQWKRRLEIMEVQATAIEDGRHNTPAAGSSDLSAKESEIAGVYTQARDQLADWLREKISNAVTNVRAQSNNVFNAASWVANCKGAINSAVSERKQELEGVCKDEDVAQRDLNGFMVRHHLDRGYHGPTVPKVVLGIGILIFCISLEMSLNMAFFSKGVGLIQGAATALSVSVANIGLGVVAGFVGLRLIINRFMVPKLLGFFVFLLALTLAVLANLFYAHAREVAQLSEEGGFQPAAALDHLLQNPWNFAGSALLFALGLIMFLVGMLDGRSSFTDGYWDYGRYAKRHIAAEKRRNEITSTLHKKIDQQLGEVPATLDQLKAKARASHEAAASALEQARARADDVKSAFGALEGECRKWINEYQATNAKVRTALKPAYFGDETVPAMPPTTVSLDPIIDLEAELSAANTKTQEEALKAQNEIAEFREKIVQKQLQDTFDDVRKQASDAVNASAAEREKLRQAGPSSNRQSP